MSTGGVKVSVSSSLIGVALYAPAIVQRLLACIFWSLLITLLLLIDLGSSYASILYVTAGLITALYSCREFLKEAPHVDVAIRLSALVAIAPFCPMTFA